MGIEVRLSKVSEPKISIITITFNAAKYLEQTLASVADQKYPNLEYIVVDGGSTDNTLEIVQAHKGLITRWISEPDNGISDAFNKGIRMTTGEVIGIINADDYYHPGALATLAKEVRVHPDHDLYYGDAIHEQFDGSGIFHFRPMQDVSRCVWKRMPVSHPATFVRKSAYEKFGLFDTRFRLAMDYELILRMFRRGARFRYVHAPLAHFRYGQPCGLAGLREVRQIGVENGLSPFVAGLRYAEAALKLWLKHRIIAFGGIAVFLGQTASFDKGISE